MEGGKVLRTKLRSEHDFDIDAQLEDFALSSAYIIVHGKDGSNVINGLYEIKNVKNQLPEGIIEGFKDFSTNKIYHNIYVSDAYGNFL